MNAVRIFLCLTITALIGLDAAAQSSSLYLAAPRQTITEDGKYVNAYMQMGSYTAVVIPEPRQFMLHDLVTIIVREASTAKLESSLDTSKDVKVSGDIQAWIDLKQILMDLRLAPTNFDNGTPEVDVNFKNEFKGDGEYERTDELVTRLTAQVVDIKPNGLLVLEARTHIENDKETLTMALTGYCRAEDVTADNTVLSTQMYDLRISKKHTGEIRKAGSKGILTKILDTIFNF